MPLQKMIRRKKNVKKGIQFCLMVCGASGTGTYRHISSYRLFTSNTKHPNPYFTITTERHLTSPDTAFHEACSTIRS